MKAPRRARVWRGLRPHSGAARARECRSARAPWASRRGGGGGGGGGCGQGGGQRAAVALMMQRMAWGMTCAALWRHGPEGVAARSGAHAHPAAGSCAGGCGMAACRERRVAPAGGGARCRGDATGCACSLVQSLAATTSVLADVWLSRAAPRRLSANRAGRGSGAQRGVRWRGWLWAM